MFRSVAAIESDFKHARASENSEWLTRFSSYVVLQKTRDLVGLQIESKALILQVRRIGGSQIGEEVAEAVDLQDRSGHDTIFPSCRLFQLEPYGVLDAWAEARQVRVAGGELVREVGSRRGEDVATVKRNTLGA